MFHVKLYVDTIKDLLVFDLPKDVSKANLEQAVRNDLCNQNTFLEIIDKGNNIIINKSNIIRCWIDEENSD